MILFCPRCGAQFPQGFKGEWFDTAPTCSECAVAVEDPPPMLAPSDAELTYGLDEWPVSDRAALVAALSAEDIPYRWEEGVVLVVPEEVEDVVDGILDDLESTDETIGGPDDAAPIDGGEEAQAAMADLFVAADRLHRSPWDTEAAVALDDLADVVAESLPPYGVDAATWQQIADLALVVGESDDEQSTLDSTAALRDFLRPLV
jgi:hypothetical protein